MLTNRNELLLQEYFLFRCALGKIVKDNKRIFDTLSKIFLIDGNSADKLFALTQNDIVCDVNTHADYMRFCRIKKYVADGGGSDDIPPDIDDVIAVKGGALEKATALKLDGTRLTEAAVFRKITDGAARGTVAALRILGFILCEGIYVDRDVNAGIKSLEKAAQWNNAEGILAALYYNQNGRAVNINRLHTVADGTVYRSFTAAAELEYGRKADGTVFESVLLNKAFALGKLTPDTYAAPYARIIFSIVLSPRDKEHTMFSNSEQAISDIGDLPLKLHGEVGAPDCAALAEIPLVRQKAHDRIRRCLFNSDLMRRSEFRPLCVCSDSQYVRRLYARFIRTAFIKAHVEFIDVAGLDAHDLQPSGKNIFVRSCDEDAANVYLMSFAGSIAAGVMQAATEFLQSRRRKKFSLVNPAVVIDLGSVLPVCFCDKTNARELKKYCDVVTIDGVTADEKPTLFNDMLCTAKRLYGVGSVTIDGVAQSRLTDMSVDGAASAIDSVVKFNRDKSETVITPALIDECGVRTEKNRYGFGGDGDEI
ncbi:MAG: sel1 repeat family protein [Clostridiales bacterium]|nr:sel1 repeat family protein [Clostridiales bacterium]